MTPLTFLLWMVMAWQQDRIPCLNYQPGIKPGIQFQSCECPNGYINAVDLSADADGTVKVSEQFCENRSGSEPFPPCSKAKPHEPCMVEQPPFDVPPVETQVPKRIAVTATSEGNDFVCTNYAGTETHRTCADKSRVLLQSEDGKFHCYSFARQP